MSESPPIPSLNYLLTSTCWRNDHNGYSHQGPGFIDTILVKQGIVTRIYLPPDANTLMAVADHFLRSRGYVNLIVIDKQPQLQWLDMDAARVHCARGASVWEWASSDGGADPDVILACAGDLIERCKDMLEQHRKYVEKNLEDMPQIRDWKWTDV